MLSVGIFQYSSDVPRPSSLMMHEYVVFEYGIPLLYVFVDDIALLYMPYQVHAS
jgi:hypothetical protein